MPLIGQDSPAARAPTGAFGLGVAMMSPLWTFYAASVTAGLGFWSMARAAGIAHGAAAPADDVLASVLEAQSPPPAAYEPGDEVVVEAPPALMGSAASGLDEGLVPAEVVAGEPLVVAEAVASPRKRRKAARAEG